MELQTSIPPALLSPEAVAEELSLAQCQSPRTAAKTLRSISPRLSHAHSSVTQNVLTLLEIHPHETLPHVADLISDNADDVTATLEAFSTLLQTDRSLLVPILGVLPDLPLTPAHILHARKTLCFALSVVDEQDLPAVIRALLYSSSTSSSSGDWAARAVRVGLSRTTVRPSPSLSPLITHVLHDAVRMSSSPVAQSLRSRAHSSPSSPLLWPDLLVWLLSLSPRLASPVPEREARASLCAAVTCGALLSTAPSKLRSCIRLIKPALPDIHHSLSHFALALVTDCPPYVTCVAGCIHILRAILVACPSVVDSIALDLASHFSTTSSTSAYSSSSAYMSSFVSDAQTQRQILADVMLRALLASQIPLPRPRSALTYSVPLAIARSSTDTDANAVWPAICIKLRKAFMFGIKSQQAFAVRLASDVVSMAPSAPLREVMSLMDECIPHTLANEAAMDFLVLFTRAVMRTTPVLDPSFINNVFDKRILAHCPKGCFREEPDEDARSIGILDATSVKLDVGLVWNQPPCAAASVITAAVASLASKRTARSSDHRADHLAFNVLNIGVLVPVVCVSLYEVVDQMNNDDDTAGNPPELFSAWNSSRSGSGCHGGSVALHNLSLPDDVTDMDTHDLAKAVSAFGVGIAAIIISLNTACCSSLPRCKRDVERRAAALSPEDTLETADHKTTWALLERLTELHRMLNALTLGHEVLLRKARGDSNLNRGRGRGRSKSGNGRNRRTSQQTKKIFNASEALLRADAVVANITTALFGSSEGGLQTQALASDKVAEFAKHRFPTLRIDTVIATLAAVPDDSEMYAEGASSPERERDAELVQMDRFLLRLLLRAMREPSSTITQSESRRALSTAVNQLNYDERTRQDQQQQQQRQQKHDLSCFGELTKGKLFEQLSSDEVSGVLDQLRKKLDANVNIFFDDTENAQGEENGEEQVQAEMMTDSCDVRWAVGVMSSSTASSSSMEYLTDCIGALADDDDGDGDNLHAADILHSPAFAALLLDRAATSTIVSRNLRTRSGTHDNMKNLIEVSGMALACLSLILRELPTFYERFCEDDNNNIHVSANDEQQNNPWEAMRTFVENMNSNVLTRVPSQFKKDPRYTALYQDDDEDLECVQNVLSTLIYVLLMTPDTAVATVASDVLLTLAELDVVPMIRARAAIFHGLATVYEVDASFWDRKDLSLVLDDPFHVWLTRRRGRVGFWEADMLLDDDSNFFDCPDIPPWVDFDINTSGSSSVGVTGGRRRLALKNGQKFLEHHRLVTFFSGLHVTHAVLEGCAWVREFWQTISLTAPSPSRKKRTLPNHGVDERQFETCDVLLDMLGLRTIVGVLLQLVHQGLVFFPVEESLPAELAHDKLKSPLYPLSLSLRLLTGIQELYYRNYCTLRNTGGVTKMDEAFEADVINKYIIALQQVAKRLDELNQWHSSESVEISQLHDNGVKLLHQIIGGSIVAVANCIQLTDTMRNAQMGTTGDGIERGKEGTNSTSRKKSGHTKRKRGQENGASAANNNVVGSSSVNVDGGEGFSRGWKLIPKLTNVCEQARKGAERLSRNMGIKNKVKLSTLAAKSVLRDNNLHFCVGIEASGSGGDASSDLEDQVVELGDDGLVAEDETEKDMDVNNAESADGFHARGGGIGRETRSLDVSTRTITVRFKRKRDRDVATS